ncbi:hypothetical protein C5167_008931 [Papaver somniferum]|uniref:Aminotransferase class I/classII large domain-containing protein n=1 Tax=Papaver somniferum TaxID=3469 RepID=A0A4Y7JZV2_PAPSO|nr:hypothetical protein C5167_008931 [Papaver somniferum]
MIRIACFWSTIRIVYIVVRTTLFSNALLLAFRHLRGLYRELVEWWRVNNLHGPVPKTTVITTPFSYGLLIAFGHIRDLFRNFIEWWSASNNLHGYAPICMNDFFTRRLYRRVQDCFNRPIASAPDSWIEVVERSYNYLGFAASDEYCTPRVIESLKKFSATTCSTRVDGGTTTLHAELEECVASFVGKEAAMVTGMGYVTNSAVLPVLIGKGGLIISDSLNHNSIVNGSRVSGASVRAFQHNSPSHLEKVLREAIAEGEGNADGQLLTHRPWKKIIVVVEGIYSMEGDLCRLTEIIAVCKKYKAYTYLDEAHTSKEVIEYLKLTCPAHLYATAISPPAAQQILSSIKVILGEDETSRGAQKLARIRENNNFFRSELQKMGFQVIRDNDSPVMPIMVYNPAKISAFSRECFKRNVAVVAVGYPAIKQLMLARVRICISASHTREDLLTALEVINQVGDLVGIKYFPAEPKKQQCKGKWWR